MRTIVIPITAAKAANTLLPLPVTLFELVAAWKFVGSDGTEAAAYSSLTVDPKGDGDASDEGAIRLQANGRGVRCGDALDAKCSLILQGVAAGDLQGYGG